MMEQKQIQIVEYKICANPECNKMFFPTHGNQQYCRAKCSCSDKRIPKTQKTCPICGKVFLGQRNRIYCSRKCCQKEHYERQCQKQKSLKINEKPLFKLQNPIAIIENVVVSYTLHREGNNEHVSHDELLWFNQKGKVGCVNLNVLKNRKWKVSDILLFNGYEIENPSLFDKEFKKLVKKLI